MPPLITPEEALRLGEIEDHAEIEALVERAWEARVERFGDSTDMCSLVNAKSGVRRGLRLLRTVALRRGGDADAPDDGPRADPRTRPCSRSRGSAPLLHGHPGPGPVKARLRQDPRRRTPRGRAHQPQALRVGRTYVHRARQSAPRGGDPARAPQRGDRLQLLRRGSTTVRYEGRLRTIKAVREAGLETCVGGILNLGESRAQRVEMAFELAAIDPTSVPINLLNPRPGTKFGDRELMDPWEAVKWIAIFRLILPEALFRVCGGRVENFGELQPLAVKAGLNGVMMGNFLTTLGAEPEQDRAMFQDSASTWPASPTTAPTPGRTTARDGWTGRRRTSLRSTSARRRPPSRSTWACGCGPSGS